MKGKMQLLTRLYTTILGSGMIFYSLGIGLITPEASFKWKMIIPGILFLLLTVIFVNIKATEKLDDRAVSNLLRTSVATLIFAVSAAISLFAALLITKVHISISAGLLAIIISVIFVFYAIAFMAFERRGS